MMTNQASPVLKVLSDDKYVRRRQVPSPFDTDYLTLSDLASLTQQIASKVRGAVFDYGSGGAPYAPFFVNCSAYVAADLEPGPMVQRVLRPDGGTDEPDAAYDFVLSTQVLEHVRDPVAYLRECLRILRPGGEILLTTHGMFHEHGCPHDYGRWTARGLEVLFQEAGYEIVRSGKLTTQIRGIVQTVNHFAHHLRYPKKRFVHLLLALVRKFYLAVMMPVLNKFADIFKDQVVAGTQAQDCIYVCVFVHARKPA